MIEPALKLEFQERAAPAVARLARFGGGFAAEHVRLESDEGFSYAWAGNSHYLAIHDIQLADGEATIAGMTASDTRDLRNSLTFLPRGCAISGWSKPMARQNSFTALYFDPAAVREELGLRFDLADPRPSLYFRNGALQSTLLKLQNVLTDPDHDDLRVESLCVLAAIEALDAGQASPVGQLSQRQLAAVLDYVSSNLSVDIGLAELAAVAGLSRYHFARAFKRTIGQSPYSFILSQRTREAANLLSSSDLPVEVVAAKVGFQTPSQFRRAFRQIMGASPQVFRRKQGL